MDPDIIINIKTEEEFNILIKRLNARGYKKSSAGDLEKVYNEFSHYDYDFCLRLDKDKNVHHDDIKYYQRNYNKRILTVDQYFMLHDPKFARPSLNKKMVEAIREVMEKTNALQHDSKHR